VDKLIIGKNLFFGNTMNWFLAAFGIGFLGSLHCAGMCGPIALAMPAAQGNRWVQLLSNLSYQIGRIVTYGFIGLLFGLIGRGFSIAGIQQPLSIALGVLMILAVVLPQVVKINQTPKILQTSISNLKKNMGNFLRKRGLSARFATGMLNGLLPCGLVYMALLGALGIGSPWLSSGFMVFFGLGTFPVMFFIAFSGQIISVKWRNIFNKVAPYAVVVLGLIFVLRGMGLGIKYISPLNNALQVEATEQCH